MLSHSVGVMVALKIIRWEDGTVPLPFNWDKDIRFVYNFFRIQACINITV